MLYGVSIYIDDGKSKSWHYFGALPLFVLVCFMVGVMVGILDIVGLLVGALDAPWVLFVGDFDGYELGLGD